MTLEVEDMTDFLCSINVFGDNSISSPLQIIDDFNEEFIKVGNVTCRKIYLERRRVIKKR